MSYSEENGQVPGEMKCCFRDCEARLWMRRGRKYGERRRKDEPSKSGCEKLPAPLTAARWVGSAVRRRNSRLFWSSRK
jgi:hypothetical protein